MSEWWSYRPSDFLMFSPRSYWRLVELYNRDVWPAQLVALAAGLLALWLAASRRDGAGRLLTALLAAAWLWVGWAFHWQRYAAINWAAPYFALAFAVQAILLVGLGVLRRDAQTRATAGLRQSLGWLLATAGVVLYPLARLLAGFPWPQLEVFGLSPEPTALASLGLLLASGYPPSRSGRWMLCIIPTLSLLVGGVTLWLLAESGG